VWQKIITYNAIGGVAHLPATIIDSHPDKTMRMTE
jgi:hypothetical protein